MRVASLVSFVVVIKDEDPNITVLLNKWLDHKRKGECSAAGVVIYIFDRIEDVNAKASIFPITFKDDLIDLLLLVEGGGFEQCVLIVDGHSTWQQKLF